MVDLLTLGSSFITSGSDDNSSLAGDVEGNDSKKLRLENLAVPVNEELGGVLLDDPGIVQQGVLLFQGELQDHGKTLKVSWLLERRFWSLKIVRMKEWILTREGFLHRLKDHLLGMQGLFFHMMVLLTGGTVGRTEGWGVIDFIF